jgi:DDE superfamily endonuclease.
MLTPYVIFLGGVYLERWYTPNTPEYPVNLSESGYMNSEISLDWLRIFDKENKSKTNGKKRLLSFDSHPSHITVEFL